MYESQAELADRLGISRALLTLYESGRRPLTVHIALRIRAIHGLSLEAIYAGVLVNKSDEVLLGEALQTKRERDGPKRKRKHAAT
jgi:transcriptional regulator with XRE-family HTH domain